MFHRVNNVQLTRVDSYQDLLIEVQEQFQSAVFNHDGYADLEIPGFHLSSHDFQHLWRCLDTVSHQTLGMCGTIFLTDGSWIEVERGDVIYHERPDQPEHTAFDVHRGASLYE